MSSEPNPILTETIDRLCRSEALTVDETSAVLHEVMEGRASEVQTAALLIAFRAKGETVGELAGMARAMRDLAVPVVTDRPGLVDTAGTGGGRPTFNVSTTAAFVAAGAGVPMAKHGNRSATGRSGSADVLEALGARIDLAPEEVAGCIEEIGFGFMFAPGHHPAMKHVVPVRKGLAVRTIFNFLGPLTNPAGASAPAHRRIRPPLPGHHGRRAGRAGLRARPAGGLRRRPGRAEHLGPDAHRGAALRRAPGELDADARGGRAGGLARSPRWPPAPRSATPRSPTRCWPATRARSAI